MNLIVIGGCNVDFIVKAKENTEPGTSNIADISVGAGGVGRNIAVNLKKMGCVVSFITCTGSDVVSAVIEEDLKNQNINYHIIKKDRSGVYLAILDNSGCLDRAFCDMHGIEEVSFNDIIKAVEEFSIYDGAVIDANLTEETITKLCEYFRSINLPYALETVSNAKAKRVIKSLNGCTLIKPNRYEAEVITGKKCITADDAKECSEIIMAWGVQNVIISLGKDGFYYKSSEISRLFSPEDILIVDVTGAGDSIIASAFAAKLMGFDSGTTAAIARHCAALTCSEKNSVSIKINPDIFKLQQ